MHRLVHNTLLALGALLLTATAQAQNYDAAADFSATNNPNAAWQYGWSTDLISRLNLYQQTNDYFGTNGNVAFWSDTSLGVVPAVFHNQTSNVYTFSSVVLQPGQLALHPGPNGQYSHVEWTAPASGNFTLDTSFIGIDTTTTDVHVLKNATSLFDSSISGKGSTANFTQEVSVVSGDVIDFAVGYGSNGNYTSDSTGLAATLTASVPEANTLLSASLLFVSGGLLLRLRRK